MPLFSSRKDEVVEEPAPLPEKKHGLFGGRHRSPSPTSTHRTSTSVSSRNSGTSFATAPSNASTGRHHSVLQRFGMGSNPDVDPSIVSARERVMSAENAEREADRALATARVQVREAREHVKRLELEAAEEARRAKIKQYHAHEVSKRGKQLGRHDV